MRVGVPPVVDLRSSARQLRLLPTQKPESQPPRRRCLRPRSRRRASRLMSCAGGRGDDVATEVRGVTGESVTLVTVDFHSPHQQRPRSKGPLLARIADIAITASWRAQTLIPSSNKCVRGLTCTQGRPARGRSTPADLPERDAALPFSRKRRGALVGGADSPRARAIFARRVMPDETVALRRYSHFGNVGVAG
jgi:hypothetical protein